MKLKVCGLTDRDNIQRIIRDVSPEYMGFIFYEPSPRYVKYKLDPAFVKSLPDNIRKTGVFVNASIEYMVENGKLYGLNTLQMHGKENPESCRQMGELGYEIIKVFNIDRAFDISAIKVYDGVCDHFLFDTAGKYQGGNGKKFNWDILEQYTLEKSYFLSGGIGPEDVGLIRSIADKKLYGVDINSLFEINKGIKDTQKVNQFSHALKNIKNGETHLYHR
jgi:phosphoribosylanthranilate isomerase